jgi:hypothetical protein
LTPIITTIEGIAALFEDRLSHEAILLRCSEINDVFTTDGADWCKLDDGTVIRLDRILSFTDPSPTDRR